MAERPGDLSRGDLGQSGRNKNVREMLFLAEQSAEGGMKVVPGKEWAYHYPKGKESREQILQGLINGTYSPEQAAPYLKPDAVVYNVEDLENEGLEAVSAKVLDATSQAAYFDYERYASFIADMKDADVDLKTIDNLYSDITRNRIQKKLRDSYGSGGQKKIDRVLQQEGKDALSRMQTASSNEKVLSALKLDWLCEDFGFVGTDQRDRALAQLSGSERELFQKLSEPYRKFVHQGDEEAYKTLAEEIRQGLPEIKKSAESGESSQSMQELDEELKDYPPESPAPGMPGDLAIPPEDSDEYHEAESLPGESAEKRKSRPIFEIEPALGGYYASGRKSYYDIPSKTWSKKKQVTPYNGNVSAKDRHRFSGKTDPGVKSLPLPNSYAFDTASLKHTGAAVEILRDQNGCFYTQTQGTAEFSIEFGKEDQLFIGAPQPEDTAQLYSGQLSAKTEQQIARLSGSNIQKAAQAQAFIHANHFYPGGGDLQKAQALQSKLRKQSTADNYMLNIDQSEYLECYSAQNKFLAMMRKAGIPSRLVLGHKVEVAVKGKSQITESTGHAWSEVWDGSQWVRFDATPPPKPEDKKKDDQQGEKQDPAPEAEDGGAENPDQQDSQQQDGQQQDNQPQDGQQQGDKSGQSQPSEKMGEASNEDVSQGEQQLQEAEQAVEEMKQAKDELNEKIAESKSFEELNELNQKVEDSDLLDDMKQDLQDKLETREDQMKDSIKEELDRMSEDGFLDEERREEMERMLEELQLQDLDLLRQKIEQESQLYNEYDKIREEVLPLVDEWLEYFIEHLPRQDEVEVDEDSLTRQGSFNRKSVQKARNLIFGTVKNPRVIRSSIKPLFLASIMLDVSGSMKKQQKLDNSRKLLVFYCELFSRIAEYFGYIRFSINAFSDNIKEIKLYDQDYDSPKSYSFPDGSNSTVKVRLMESLMASGGTNMLDPIKQAARELNVESQANPGYASAFYFIGDGEDTQGNSVNVAKFLELNDEERGFGDHMRSAIMLGNESQRQTLANIFGDEHTTVAGNFDALIEQSMLKFEEDIEDYLKNKTS